MSMGAGRGQKQRVQSTRREEVDEFYLCVGNWGRWVEENGTENTTVADYYGLVSQTPETMSFVLGEIFVDALNSGAITAASKCDPDEIYFHATAYSHLKDRFQVTATYGNESIKSSSFMEDVNLLTTKMRDVPSRVLTNLLLLTLNWDN